MKMGTAEHIFTSIYKLIHEDGQRDYLSALMSAQENLTHLHHIKTFLSKIFVEIDNLSTELMKDNEILVSVKNQKLLQVCFQLVTSLGISPSLIAGLGIHLSKRCSSAIILTTLVMNDDEKYELLVDCTDFFTRCYKIPVLKNIIVTFHLVDYLACLIQLSYAPLKKPGSYSNYIMTQEKYDELKHTQQKYSKIYEELVNNCFQPILMKELLVLQGVSDPSPPIFVKRIIAKEMSQRLIAPEGLLSLIRCFIESYNIDTGFEWRKIDMISKLISVKHGSDTLDKYLQNVSSQIIQILTVNNTHYIAAVTACAISLNEKYSESDHVKALIKEIFHVFDISYLISSSNLPGTVILSPLEIEHKINILYAGLCTTKLDYPSLYLLPNLYILFLLGVNCTRNEELKTKIKEVILKCLQQVNRTEMHLLLKQFLFGKDKASKIAIEEYDAGLSIKYVSTPVTHQQDDALLYFLNLFRASTDNSFFECVFEVSLQMLIDLNVKRQTKGTSDQLIDAEEDPVILDCIDEQYLCILELLSEISSTPKAVSSLKTNPYIVLNFIEHFIIKNRKATNDECFTIALVLLNTILSNTNKTKELENKFGKLIPVLKLMAEDDSNFNNILCKEALSLLTLKEIQTSDTEFAKAMSDVCDDLLPVRVHGIIALTKLIECKDPETISKKHYVFCLFQEQLKDSDSYMYLSAVNGIAALCTHCTEDVLYVLCKEFLNVSNEDNLDTKENQNKIAELQMKIGDIVVKVTKRLGEMAIVHKTILLNTMLCACRHADPLIRTSALSNLAEIALVLHYKIGSIIYEMLYCIWSILETDKAIECRRAAVMVISSLIKGLGKEVLVELKEDILPIYRTLKDLYRDPDEDSVLRLHAQLALEELNDIVNDYLFPRVKLEKQIYVLDESVIK